MDDNKFFKFVWRFNAISIAGIVFIVAIGLLWEIFLQDMFRVNNVSNIVAVDGTQSDDAPKTEEVLSTSLSGPHNDAQHYIVSLSSNQIIDRVYSSDKKARSARNVGLLYIKSGKVDWFFEGKDQLILTTHRIYENSISLPNTYSNQAQPHENELEAIALSYVDKDTNGDHRLSRNDLIKLVLVSIDGRNRNVVLENLLSSPLINDLDQTRLLVQFENEEGKHWAILDKETLSLGETKQIPLP